VLEGGPSHSRRPEPEEAPKPKPDRVKLRRELSAAETREHRAEVAVERERATIRDLDRKRSEAKDRLRAAEAELRGVSLERKRLASALDKLGDR
jgi:chromosome segregation ATPase